MGTRNSCACSRASAYLSTVTKPEDYDDVEMIPTEIPLVSDEAKRNLYEILNSNSSANSGTGDGHAPMGESRLCSFDVFMEEKLEYNFRNVVEQSLWNVSILAQERPPQIVLWRTKFYDIKILKKLPASYVDFEKLKLIPASSLECPILLLSDLDLVWGNVPIVGNFKRYICENVRKFTPRTLIQAILADSISRKNRFGRVNMQTHMTEVLEFLHFSFGYGYINCYHHQNEEYCELFKVLITTYNNVIGKEDFTIGVVNPRILFDRGSKSRVISRCSYYVRSCSKFYLGIDASSKIVLNGCGLHLWRGVTLDGANALTDMECFRSDGQFVIALILSLGVVQFQQL
ncbi:uncharacterized protein LOC113330705 [Papaver somniferum]|uniref:uncharacterized protein LOC113330705 n=1 Tax=Papaver somniferum TaxID=3469 RepID=UPI000E6FDBB1|nr:uncharacterized protein LOC113330705 [Papaver somniferum]